MEEVLRGLHFWKVVVGARISHRNKLVKFLDSIVGGRIDGLLYRAKTLHHLPAILALIRDPTEGFHYEFLICHLDFGVVLIAQVNAADSVVPALED